MNILIAAIILILIVLLVVFLLGPFRLYFNLGKADKYMQGFYKISFLGFTLKKGEIPSTQLISGNEIVGSQEHYVAITSKATEALESESSDENRTKDITGINRKPSKIPSQSEIPSQSKIPPQAQLRLIGDAFPQIAQILIDLIKSINISKFFCEISFGLDDPVDTAVVSGYLWSIASVTGLYRTNFFIEPRFDGAQLEGSILAVIEARMLWFVVAAVKALEDDKTRKLIFELVKGELH